MLPSFAHDSIVRIRPGIKTERGSVVPDWSADKITKLTINGCSLQPASTSLDQDGRVLAVMDGLTAYIPEGSDVKAGDRIDWDGEHYTIDGVPRKWPGALMCSHIQLNLKRWEG